MDASNSVTIQSFEDITSNADSAADGLEALAESLDKLNRAVKNTRLDEVTKQLDKAVSSINSAVKKLEDLEKAVKNISGGSKNRLSSIADQLGKIDKSFENLNSSGMKGAIANLQVLTTGFNLTAQGAKDLYDGLAGKSDSALSGIASLIGGIGTNAAAGAQVGGPVGALIGGLAGVAEAFITVAGAEEEYRQRALTEAFFDNKGQSIEDLAENMMESLEPIGNYTERMAALNEQSRLAGRNFDTAYGEIDKLMKLEVNTENLATLKDLFADLAQSAQDMADANFNKIFESLNSAVDKYLTKDALKAIEKTTADLAYLQRMVTGKISGISQRASEILEMLANTDDPMSISVGKQQLAVELGKLKQYADVDAQVRQEHALEKATAGVNFGSSASAAISSIGNVGKLLDEMRTSSNNAFEEGEISLEIVRRQAQLMGIKVSDKDYNSWLNALKISRDSQLKDIDAQSEKIQQQLLSDFKKRLLNMIPTIMDGASYSPILYGKQGWLAQLSLGGPFGIRYAAEKGTTLADAKNKIKVRLTTDINSLNTNILKYIKFDDGKTALDIYNAIQKLASGGFVQSGQLFVAREAGPELVGSIGGRTAVANNEQIVAAVSAGVAQAVAAAISPQGNGQQINLNVYLDGEQITAAVERTQSRQGMKLLRTGGY